ncbi:GrpB family protein [Paenibacillus sp. VTT E-133280]|jgi:GrpB-like predicted nucleotidyltransferase (UPF0157 family)|uniref:GrpB family protein n=1 Tax=Paenibacillus sp. VTT E-133280 TaxID=1986222 RepID=UPI00211B3DE4|nr:GrpB family protein [Paenibacillus sp. VTT E-133280]
MDVTVTQYNEEWNLIFQEESRKIKEIFADALIDIHHIGSTSVPGLKAKPIIDMMPVERNIRRTLKPIWMGKKHLSLN